jgi:hypothetical protein
MGRYTVNAVIVIDADSHDDFAEAWENKDWDDYEIIAVTEPEDE